MKRITLYLFNIVICLAVFAQKQTPPAGGTPKDFTLPEKTTFQLDNGLTVVMIPYGNLPKVTVSAVVKTGNIHEGEGQIWLADITADLMQEGTTTRTTQEVSLAAANTVSYTHLTLPTILRV